MSEQDNIFEHKQNLSPIVTAGILPAIQRVIDEATSEDHSIDWAVASIGELINTYNTFYSTGRGKV